MSLNHSQASISVEDDTSAEVDNKSTPEGPVEQVKRRRRWTFRLKDKGDGDGKIPDNSKFKALTVSCRCKGAIKGSCLILVASFIELLGNLIALLYGVSYILGAVNFYELDSDPEKRAKEYEEQLQQVLFLEKYRVGFVGLLAICLVGLVISFLMPIGTIYKSWKSIRTAMSLLFSMIVFHTLLVLLYLPDSQLQSTAAAIPFRAYELFLLYCFIRYYKKKKLEEIKAGYRRICGTPGTAGQQSQDCIDTTSLFSMNDEQLLNTALMDNGSEMQATFDITEGTIVMPPSIPPENIVVMNTQSAPFIDEKNRKKRNRILKAWKKQSKKAQVHYAPMVHDRGMIDYK